MRSIENLKIFIERADQPEADFSPEYIESLGNDLIQASEERSGYNELAWAAGAYLQILAMEKGIDEYYERFGFQAVANALRATFMNGDFPAGLGFLNADFVPNGNNLAALARNPKIREALGSLHTAQCHVSIENFASASTELRRATLLFLNFAPVAGLASSSCLQICASLLAATPESDPEREQVLKCFLDLLLQDERDINLLYCWQAAVRRYPQLAREGAYFDTVSHIIRRCREEEAGVVMLEQLLSDQQLVDLITNDQHLSILVGLAGWWLFARQGRNGRAPEVARQLLWQLDHSPILYRVLTSFLDRKQPQVLSPKEVDDLQREFQQIMLQLHKESRLRTYRGIPLAIQIWRDNLINIFEPIYEALESSSALDPKVVQKIQTLDGEALVHENPLQREPLFREIEGKLLGNLIRDHKTIVKLLREALKLRLQLSENASIDQETAGSLFQAEVKQEVADLCAGDSNLHWAVEWFLPETLSIS